MSAVCLLLLLPLVLLLQVVSMCLVLCAMLEGSHAISLSSSLMSELWPCVDGEARCHSSRGSRAAGRKAGAAIALLAPVTC
jgi:hypothetical protein